MSSGVSWGQVSAAVGPTLAALGWIGRWLNKRLSKIDEHLDEQDSRHLALAQRTARLEGAVRATRQAVEAEDPIGELR